MPEEIYLKRHPVWPSVREIVINRPEKRNALTLSMWHSLRKLVDVCNRDKTIRLIVLRSADAVSFASGADISEFPELRSNSWLAKKHKQVTDDTTKALMSARPIVVCVIQGFCFGGGMQLASACDLRLADDTAQFAITPVKLGFVYGRAETELLIRLVGEARAKEMLYTAKAISAQEAYEFGFIHSLYSGNNFPEFVDEYLYTLLQSAPEAQQATKRMFRCLAESPGRDTPLTNRLVSDALDGSEYREGIQAFLEKRKPAYAESQIRE